MGIGFVGFCYSCRHSLSCFTEVLRAGCCYCRPEGVGMNEIANQTVLKALDEAASRVRRNLSSFTYECQNHSSVNNSYPAVENNQWTCGFWPGDVCLAYEHTSDPVFLHAAYSLCESFLSRIEQKIEVDHHDMGFLSTPSCVSLYKLDGSLRARRAALLAADQLLTRKAHFSRPGERWGRRRITASSSTA